MSGFHTGLGAPRGQASQLGIVPSGTGSGTHSGGPWWKPLFSKSVFGAKQLSSHALFSLESLNSPKFHKWREKVSWHVWVFPSENDVKVLVVQSCWTLCDPTDFRPPGSSVCGILQARTLECVAIPFFRESSQPRGQTWVSCIAGQFFTFWATSVSKYGFQTLLYRGLEVSQSP